MSLSVVVKIMAYIIKWWPPYAKACHAVKRTIIIILRRERGVSHLDSRSDDDCICLSCGRVQDWLREKRQKTCIHGWRKFPSVKKEPKQRKMDVKGVEGGRSRDSMYSNIPHSRHSIDYIGKCPSSSYPDPDLFSYNGPVKAFLPGKQIRVEATGGNE